MMIRLNPRHPLVWRSPDTIQLGIDRPVVVLHGLTQALEQVLAAVQVGVPLSGAVMLGQHAGATEAEVLDLVRALDPALLGVAADAPPRPVDAAGARPEPWVLLDGEGATAERIRRVLVALGVPLGPPGRVTSRSPALAVIVGHFALEPARYARWLRRDVPHLPVVFSDSEVRIGPVVTPGTGPCLYCLELHRMDADEAWQAIASQLLFRRAATETPARSLDVACRVVELVQDHLRDPPALTSQRIQPAQSLVITVDTGAVTRREHLPHERCACRALPENVTVPEESAAANQPSTSSGSGDGGPG
jgi:bacteriocin biosynthesis cyclodehydratase domain-containing protein